MTHFTYSYNPGDSTDVPYANLYADGTKVMSFSVSPDEDADRVRERVQEFTNTLVRMSGGDQEPTIIRVTRYE